LEQSRPATRVIFMSGYHQHAPMIDSQFISKPFNRTTLLDKVRGALAHTESICVA
jgi:FixJ family two-component response regulator